MYMVVLLHLFILGFMWHRLIGMLKSQETHTSYRQTYICMHMHTIQKNNNTPRKNRIKQRRVRETDAKFTSSNRLSPSRKPMDLGFSPNNKETHRRQVLAGLACFYKPKADQACVWTLGANCLHQRLQVLATDSKQKGSLRAVQHLGSWSESQAVSPHLTPERITVIATFPGGVWADLAQVFCVYYLI